MDACAVGDDPIATLLKSYSEFNRKEAEELKKVPAPYEFMRYVARNRPFVVRGGAATWAAVRRWDAQYLRDKLVGNDVKVAVTPEGNADAIVKQPDGELLFVEPYELSMDFGDFLDIIQEDSGYLPCDARPKNVFYAQTQENSNLQDEYKAVMADVPPHIPFATTALGKQPDAVNLWLGNDRSVTSLHKDNYENIYVQVRGKKTFVLAPPIAMPCVNETNVQTALYKPDSRGLGIKDTELHIVRHDEPHTIPFPTWDPEDQYTRATAYSHLADWFYVILEEGDMFYLPAMWYHKVSQQAGDEGFALSVNYWYDMAYDGSFWGLNSFVRDVAKSTRERTGDTKGRIRAENSNRIPEDWSELN